MDLSTKINLTLSISSFVLAAISVITVVITLLQNSKMIENSTRPYLCIYGQCINTGHSQFYLVLKNFGASAATVTKFQSSFDLSEFKSSRTFIEEIRNTTIAPGQSRICLLEYETIPDNITFDLEYKSGKRNFSETFSGNIKAATAMLSEKASKNDLRNISYTLQEMLQKDL